MFNPLNYFRRNRENRLIFPARPSAGALKMYFEEQRTCTLIGATTSTVVLPAQLKYDVEVIEITIQCLFNASDTFTVFEKNTQISGPWKLINGQFACLAGKIIDRNNDLIVQNVSSIGHSCEVRWIPYLRRNYNPEWRKL